MLRASILMTCLALASPLGAQRSIASHKPSATYVSTRWQLPRLEVEAEPPPTETLADALDAAYRDNPTLQVNRYELRTSDEEYAQALSQLRMTSQLQVTGSYTKTVPGRTTQANRSFADRLGSAIETSNSLSAALVIDQPLYTGGKASADITAAAGAIDAERERLRSTEGDLFLRTITVYADIRRDSRVLALRRASVKQLESTYYEVTARRIAGELTRTDIAQASTQVDAAIAQANAAEEQLAQDRSAYTALVGREPGLLAPLPMLPQLPHTIDDAFSLALRLNPDLGQALAAERASRARIASAAAEARPKLSLRGVARLGGQGAPFHLYNEDQEFAGQAVLTVPLSQGGRIGSLVAQAHNRNAADRIRIEGARRAMVQAVVDSWNAMATAQRNVEVQEAQLQSARVLDEGTFEEYRAGLRSTFDVLYAHGSLRDAEIALEMTRRDLYVAQAALLRQVGLLEARTILSTTPLYDPDANTRKAAGRGSLPWDSAVRTLDRFRRPTPDDRGIEQPPRYDGPPQIIPATQMPTVGPTSAPATATAPLPGTTGAARPLHEIKQP